MRKGNLLFLILLVSIFAFSLYALEKQGTPLVKKEKPLSSSEKGVDGCCKEKEGEPSLTTAPAQKPVELQVKGEKNAPSKKEEKPIPQSEKKSQSGKEPSSDVAPPKKPEKKKEAVSEEEEGEEEEEFEEYGDEGPDADEDTDFSGY